MPTGQHKKWAAYDYALNDLAMQTATGRYAPRHKSKGPGIPSNAYSFGTKHDQMKNGITPYSQIEKGKDVHESIHNITTAQITPQIKMDLLSSL